MGIHLLLADARHIYRSGLRAIFSCESEVVAITEAVSGEDLLRQLASRGCDFVIAHQSLIPTLSLLPQGRFALFTSQPDKETLLAAYEHGVRGYFSENPPADLLKAILHLPAGQCPLDPAFTFWAVELIADGILPGLDPERLTNREQEILVLQQRGLSYTEIADQLCIATSTVKRHVATIRSKLRLQRGSGRR